MNEVFELHNFCSCSLHENLDKFRYSLKDIPLYKEKYNCKFQAFENKINYCYRIISAFIYIDVSYRHNNQNNLLNDEEFFKIHNYLLTIRDFYCAISNRHLSYIATLIRQLNEDDYLYNLKKIYEFCRNILKKYENEVKCHPKNHYF